MKSNWRYKTTNLLGCQNYFVMFWRLPGIGPAYSTKALRLGVRVCDLIADDFSKFEGKFRLIVNYYTQLFEEIAQEYTEEKIQQELKRSV